MKAIFPNLFYFPVSINMYTLKDTIWTCLVKTLIIIQLLYCLNTSVFIKNIFRITDKACILICSGRLTYITAYRARPFCLYYLDSYDYVQKTNRLETRREFIWIRYYPP